MPDDPSPIRIVWIFPTLDYGGAERQHLELACAIDKRRFDPHVVLLNDRRRLLDDQYGRIDGLSIHVVPPRSAMDPRRLTDLIRLLKQVKPEVVHTVLPAANLWGLLAARLAGFRPCIGSLRGLRLDRRSRWYWMDRLCLRYLADAVVVNSDTVRENCVRGLGVNPDKVHRMYNGVRPPKAPDGRRDDFLRSLGVPATDHPVLSFLGRLDANKSVADILSAVLVLRDRGRPVTLLIAGSGPCLSELRRQARQTGIEELVVFAGPVRDVSRFMQSTDVFVCASRSEGFPNVVLEAMTSGVFVVASDISAHRELIRRGETGLLFEAGNPRALADAVQEGLDRPEDRRRIADRACAEVRTRFGLDEMVKSFQDFYRQLWNEARP